MILEIRDEDGVVFSSSTIHEEVTIRDDVSVLELAGTLCKSGSEYLNDWMVTKQCSHES